MMRRVGRAAEVDIPVGGIPDTLPLPIEILQIVVQSVGFNLLDLGGSRQAEEKEKDGGK